MKNFYQKHYQYLGVGVYFPESYSSEHIFSGLHIHLIRCDKTCINFEKIENNLMCSSVSRRKFAANVMFQWGSPNQLKNCNRQPIVYPSTINYYGSFGIGSYATGGRESDRIFWGCGEAIQLDKHFFRIRKGDLKATDVLCNARYPKLWMMQTTKFNANYLKIKSAFGISSRKEMVNKITQTIDQIMPFMTLFRCAPINHKKILLRSNGILPEEINEVEEPNKCIFPLSVNSYPEGGHLLDKEDNMGEELEDVNLAIFECFIQPIEQLLILGDVHTLMDCRSANMSVLHHNS